MRARTGALAGLMAIAAAAYGDDLIGSSKAPEVLKKVGAELGKKKGYHVKLTLTVPGLPGGGGGAPGLQEQSFEGVVKGRDFAALKGAAEAYCKGPVILIRTADGKFVEPKDVQGQQEQIVAAAVRNPAVICADVVRFAGPSTFTGDEKVGERDCKVADTWADQKSTEDQIKEILKNVRLPQQLGNLDLMQFVDKKKSTSAYKARVGKEDLLFHKIEWTMTIVIDKRKIPPVGQQIPDKLEAKYTLDISDHDKDLDVDVPKEIRARFGLKDEKKK